MKLKINRETTIGLSVLLALLVILGAVGIHRFFRRHIPSEEIVAMEEAKLTEEPRADREEHEVEWPRKPEPLSPVAMANRDGVPPPLEDREHWNNASKEKRVETPTSSKVLSLITSGPPMIEKSERREHERKTLPSPSIPSPADDRYSPEALSHEKKLESLPTAPTAPFADGRAMDRSKPIVVEVGEDQADRASRSPDRYAAKLDSHPIERIHRDPGKVADAMGAALADSQQIPPHDRPGAGMLVDREAAGKLDKPQSVEERRFEERRIEERRTEEHRDGGLPTSRYVNESTFSGPPGNVPRNFASAPVGYAPSNYSGVPGGYSLDNSLRPGGEVPGRIRAENRLRDDGMYEVQPNDSYWTISERVYGSGAYFRALAEQNRGKAARPDRLPPGLVISTPPVAQLGKDYPDLCPRPNRRETVRNRADSLHGYPVGTAGGGRTYLVQEGDTLSSIARNELGKVSRWAEIYQLNREALGKDFDYLTPGMRLVLPIRESQSGERTTRRDDRDAPLLR